MAPVARWPALGLAMEWRSCGSAAPQREVKPGGFASATTDAGTAQQPRQTPAAAAVQPVVILDKPNPSYTAVARKLGLEGEVLVEVVFPASGPVRVVRVIKGLGHGLDESAQRAAEQIRFKPALQNGQPVDFPATVHIVFQIAYEKIGFTLGGRNGVSPQ